MKTRTTFRHVPAFLAAAAFLLPTPIWSQEAKRPAGQSTSERKNAPKAIVPDVLLSKNGSLRGTLIDGTRQPLKKTTVALKRDGKLISSTTTNDQGEYSFAKLKSGPYQLEIEKQTVAIRVWSPVAAPSQSLKQLDMAYVPDPDVVRGQFGYLDPVNTSLLLLGITGVVLGGVAIAEINDLEDDIKKLQSP